MTLRRGRWIWGHNKIERVGHDNAARRSLGWFCGGSVEGKCCCSRAQSDALYIGLESLHVGKDLW